jgi:hypothetical protein
MISFTVDDWPNIGSKQRGLFPHRVAKAAEKEWKRRGELLRPIALTIKVVYPLPANGMKVADRAAALRGTEFPTMSHHTTAEIEKQVLDGLVAAKVLSRERIVCDAHTTKRIGANPRTEITLTEAV